MFVTDGSTNQLDWIFIPAYNKYSYNHTNNHSLFPLLKKKIE